jgi:hypothetical protein
MPSWQTTLRRSFRPWWGLGIIVRQHLVVMTREGDQEDVLAGLVELKAQFPGWDFELHRAA